MRTDSVRQMFQPYIYRITINQYIVHRSKGVGEGDKVHNTHINGSYIFDS